MAQSSERDGVGKPAPEAGQRQLRLVLTIAAVLEATLILSVLGYKLLMAN